MDRYYPLPISGPQHPNPAAIDPVDRAARSSVQTPAPTHPIVPQRNSSGTVVHEKEGTSESVETTGGPDDVQAMSPRRTSEDIEVLSREVRAELSRHARALRESLHLILYRIEAVKAHHGKLDSNNKLMQTCIRVLMSWSKSTASDSREKN
ncbi:hypothetical protein EDB81DRAFT_670281 [Dactylonectria macrodidyma]|uniref:Uncharacterized protein n=1 Tax=Dactylonectria macrodidyma TaxID=307937 RepID=A0A9P9D692_9HYPO|nr:hypothetical protein EDB81DRAFT_670281 [Dactylonectria macrodidyma]